MKEITEKKTRIEEITKYQAADGKMFYDKSECVQYEQTALCAVRSIVNQLSKRKFNGISESVIFQDAFDDNWMTIVVPHNEDDIKTIVQYSALENGEDGMCNLPITAIGKHVAIISNYDGDIWFVIIEDYIEKITSKLKEFDESEN